MQSRPSSFFKARCKNNYLNLNEDAIKESEKLRNTCPCYVLSITKEKLSFKNYQPTKNALKIRKNAVKKITYKK
jgi:hypothetical protein